MKRLILLITIFGCAAGASANELWLSAVDLYRQYGDLLPGRMLIEFTQYNGAGEEVSDEQSLLRFSLGPDGEPETEVIWARKDGEDVTRERREDPQSGAPFGGQAGDDDDGEGGNAFSGLQKSPFDPAEQQNVEYTDTRQVERVGGMLTRRFEFVHHTEADAPNIGTAWLALDSGMPVKLELTLERLPLFVESLVMRQFFGLDAEQRWVSTALEFSGAGSVLFFRREIESRLEFSDYFRAP